jgi:hypothetical protein
MSKLPKASSFLVAALAGCIMLASPVRAQLFTFESENVPPEVERIYMKGLQFLVKTQKSEGTWPGSYGSDPGVVGLAILSILAHGEDPNFGPYSHTIQAGLNFILKSQNQKTGYIGSSPNATARWPIRGSGRLSRKPSPSSSPRNPTTRRVPGVTVPRARMPTAR